MDAERQTIQAKILNNQREKEALDKSLTTLEMENLELQKHVHNLTAQIAKLENARTSVYMTEMSNTREKYQAELERLKAERDMVSSMKLRSYLRQ